MKFLKTDPPKVRHGQRTLTIVGGGACDGLGRQAGPTPPPGWFARAGSGNTRRIELNERHLEILEAVGDLGITPDELGFRMRVREFDDLRTEGLIVYWPEGAPLPPQVVGRPSRSGTWNLTASGMEARGLPPLRFT